MADQLNPQTKAQILRVAVEKINKQFGQGSVWSVLDNQTPKIQTVSTGAITLDKALGGGLPRGRITELYGPEAVGKTSLALSVIRAVQQTGGVAGIIDVEHAMDLQYAEKVGVNIKELLISQPDSAEQALDIAETLVRNGIDCLVLDSVAMLVTEAEIQGDMSDMQIGSQARLIGKALRKLTAPIDKSSTVFILINQIRSNIGGYGNPEVTPGGKAIKYMSSVRIDLRKKEQIKDADQQIGIRVVAKVVKNKIAPPGKQGEFSIIFGKGIDTQESLIDAAIGEGIFTRSGAWTSYGEEKFLGVGKVKDWLKEHPEIEKELWAKVIK